MLTELLFILTTIPATIIATTHFSDPCDHPIIIHGAWRHWDYDKIYDKNDTYRCDAMLLPRQQWFTFMLHGKYCEIVAGAMKEKQCGTLKPLTLSFKNSVIVNNNTIDYHDNNIEDDDDYNNDVDKIGNDIINKKNNSNNINDKVHYDLGNKLFLENTIIHDFEDVLASSSFSTSSSYSIYHHLLKSPLRLTSLIKIIQQQKNEYQKKQVENILQQLQNISKQIIHNKQQKIMLNKQHKQLLKQVKISVLTHKIENFFETLSSNSFNTPQQYSQHILQKLQQIHNETLYSNKNFKNNKNIFISNDNSVKIKISVTNNIKKGNKKSNNDNRNKNNKKIKNFTHIHINNAKNKNYRINNDNNNSKLNLVLKLKELKEYLLNMLEMNEKENDNKKKKRHDINDEENKKEGKYERKSEADAKALDKDEYKDEKHNYDDKRVGDGDNDEDNDNDDDDTMTSTHDGFVLARLCIHHHYLDDSSCLEDMGVGVVMKKCGLKGWVYWLEGGVELCPSGVCIKKLNEEIPEGRFSDVPVSKQDRYMMVPIASSTHHPTITLEYRHEKDWTEHTKELRRYLAGVHNDLWQDIRSSKRKFRILANDTPLLYHDTTHTPEFKPSLDVVVPDLDQDAERKEKSDAEKHVRRKRKKDLEFKLTRKEFEKISFLDYEPKTLNNILRISFIVNESSSLPNGHLEEMIRLINQSHSVYFKNSTLLSIYPGLPADINSKWQNTSWLDVWLGLSAGGVMVLCVGGCCLVRASRRWTGKRHKGIQTDQTITGYLPVNKEGGKDDDEEEGGSFYNNCLSGVYFDDVFEN